MYAEAIMRRLQRRGVNLCFQKGTEASETRVFGEAVVRRFRKGWRGGSETLP